MAEVALAKIHLDLLGFADNTNQTYIRLFGENVMNLGKFAMLLGMFCVYTLTKEVTAAHVFNQKQCIVHLGPRVIFDDRIELTARATFHDDADEYFVVVAECMPFDWSPSRHNFTSDGPTGVDNECVSRLLSDGPVMQTCYYPSNTPRNDVVFCDATIVDLLSYAVQWSDTPASRLKGVHTHSAVGLYAALSAAWLYSVVGAHSTPLPPTLVVSFVAK